MRHATFVLALPILIGISACAKKQPTSKPVVVEDVIPFGTPVCFPKGITNPSTQPGATQPSDDIAE